MTTIRHLANRIPDKTPVAPHSRGSPAGTRPQSSSPASFADALRKAQQEQTPIKISAHAQQRMVQRNISMQPEELQALEQAVTALHKRGGKEALILREDAAFVVNIPNKTVVTAIDRTELRDRIFTQIDSAILI